MPTMIQNLLFKSTNASAPTAKAELPADGADFKTALKSARKEKPKAAESLDKPAAKNPTRKPKDKNAKASETDDTRPADEIDRSKTETDGVESKLPTEKSDEVDSKDDTKATDSEEPTKNKKDAGDATNAQLAIQPVTAATKDDAKAKENTGESTAEDAVAALAVQEAGGKKATDAAADAVSAESDAAAEDSNASAGAQAAQPAKQSAGVAQIATDDQDVAAQPVKAVKKEAGNSSDALPNATADAAAAAVASVIDDHDSHSDSDSLKPATTGIDAKTLDIFNPAAGQTTAHQTTATSAPAAPPVAPEAQFAAANHPTIVTGIRSQLMPNGGTMHIRLDPPELGAMQVIVQMKDGVMTASFQTSNDDATRMLSHSLGDLKHALETSGVSVEKLHVQQSPRDQQASGDENQQQQSSDQNAQQQEQQRREMLRRMWRKLAGGEDPLDLVA